MFSRFKFTKLEIKLKDPSEVYYEIYNNAKKKAKELKQNAINAFLELNNIKKKYNLSDILDSDGENEEFLKLIKLKYLGENELE